MAAYCGCEGKNPAFVAILRAALSLSLSLSLSLYSVFTNVHRVWRYQLRLASYNLQLPTQKGFIPLCISVMEPVADPETGKPTGQAGSLSHRYIYVVDADAQGAWAGQCGFVAVNARPWYSTLQINMHASIHLSIRRPSARPPLIYPCDHCTIINTLGLGTCAVLIRANTYVLLVLLRVSSPEVLTETGECFPSMTSFVRNSPNLMTEVTTYKFPQAATRPHMLAYLDAEMAKQRELNAVSHKRKPPPPCCGTGEAFAEQIIAPSRDPRPFADTVCICFFGGGCCARSLALKSAQGFSEIFCII
jgi:hypothetical protein